MMKGILLDLSGTIYVGHTPLPGAAAALRRLSDAGVPHLFVTNTSRRTRKKLWEDLCEIGFNIDQEHIFSAPLAVRRYLEQHRLRPFLLVHQNLMTEFDGLPRENPNAVVIGDAEDNFTFRKMNEAFRLLKRGARLVATGYTRYFEGAGGLELDVGPFVAALEYAADTKAVVLGKPAAFFFSEAATELGLEPEECIMVGDDAESDVAAAIAAGLEGILVQTGKYRPGDEAKIAGDYTMAPNIVAAVDKILLRIEREL